MILVFSLLYPYHNFYSHFQLEPYMDEAFLSNAMSILGQDGVVSIKVRDKWE